MPATPDATLAELAKLVEQCDNFISLADNRYMTSLMKADALHTGMKAVRDQLKALFLANGGENVWEFSSFGVEEVE